MPRGFDMLLKTYGQCLVQMLSNQHSLWLPGGERDEYSMGSYSFLSVGLDFDSAANKISQSVDGKVFFAGEHTSADGWAGTHALVPFKQVNPLQVPWQRASLSSPTLFPLPSVVPKKEDPIRQTVVSAVGIGTVGTALTSQVETKKHA